MKYLGQSFSRPASVLVLAVALTAAVSAQSVPPSGSFGYLLNAFLGPQSTDSGTAILGVMNFDGAGNVTGSYNFQRGATSTKSAKTSTGTFTGTYSSNPDGTGSVTIAFDAGLTVTFTVVITDSGNGLQLVATNLMGGDISGTVISGFARAAYAGSPQGSYGFQLNNSPVPGGIIGVATFDGAGNVAVSFTAVGVGQDPSQPPISSGTLTGTYSLNSDGSDTLTMVTASGQSAGTYVMVITDRGSGALLLQTTGTGSNVSYGTARLQ